MFYDLSSDEKNILELFVKQEKDNDFELEKNIKKYDTNKEILVKLIEKGLINAHISTGFHGNIEIEYNYKNNGHKLSNEVLKYYGLK